MLTSTTVDISIRLQNCVNFPLLNQLEYCAEFADLRFERESHIRSQYRIHSSKPKPCNCIKKPPKAFGRISNTVAIIIDPKTSRNYLLPFFYTGWRVRDCFFPHLEIFEVPFFSPIIMQPLEEEQLKRFLDDRAEIVILHKERLMDSQNIPSNFSNELLWETRRWVLAHYFDKYNEFYTANFSLPLENLSFTSLPDWFSKLLSQSIASSSWEFNVERIIPLFSGTKHSTFFKFKQYSMSRKRFPDIF